MSYDVTIGIPFYRSVDTIAQTLESAMSQTYESIEFLLIDDGGNDGSLAKVQNMIQHHLRRKDVRIISHEHNMGVAASRNEIIDKAQGEFVYFLDSDDDIYENTISLLMKHAREYNAEIVFGSYVKFDLDRRETIYQYPYKVFTEPDQLATFAYRKYGNIQASACNYIVKTSLLRTNKHYFLNSNYWEDLVFTFDLVTLTSRAVLLPDITYTYLCRPNSLSHYQERDNVSKEEIMQTVHTIDHLKQRSPYLVSKTYYPNRCYQIVLTDFYIACRILKLRNHIVPKVPNSEIKQLMRHPATFRQICSFRQSRIKNLFLYLIGNFPAFLCVFTIWCLGKVKKLI
jgi:glycosyltransferase involved in cell wall biosynthesis